MGKLWNFINKEDMSIQFLVRYKRHFISAVKIIVPKT
jgi:hypothetical protein